MTIIQDCLSTSLEKMRRFPTGLSHFVFDVTLRNGNRYVIRIARPERKQEFEQGLYWQAALEKLKISLPEIYHTGEIKRHPFAVYARLPGQDLEAVYASLSPVTKKVIAHEVADIQLKIQTLDRRLFAKIDPWPNVLQTMVSRSQGEIEAHGLVDSRFVPAVREQNQIHWGYLDTVKSVPFLYDLNVRNVIVDDGRVSGIIDVDAMWFGDPLLAIGRGKTILLMMEQDTDFITYWCAYLALSERQVRVVDFYALLYAVRFMGTIGQELNDNYSIQTDPGKAQLLENIAIYLLEQLN